MVFGYSTDRDIELKDAKLTCVTTTFTPKSKRQLLDDVYHYSKRLVETKWWQGNRSYYFEQLKETIERLNKKP